jgi:hypothetical protein
MSAPTRTTSPADTQASETPRLTARRREQLIQDAEMALVDAEIEYVTNPDLDRAAALRAAEEHLRQTYLEHRGPGHRYSGAFAGLDVIDVERNHLPKQRPGSVPVVLATELSSREAGLWDAIADAATEPLSITSDLHTEAVPTARQAT